MTERETAKNVAQKVLYPAITYDYRLVNGPKGLAMVANRNIKKGKMVFGDSIEFMFTDVQEEHDGGDKLYLCRHKQASRKGKTKVPSYFPLTRDILTRTHGVPVLHPDPTGESAGIESWMLEVPGMLINHSCDPNVKDDSHNAAKGEAYAVRDIKKGEELTYEYTLQYYDHGPFFEECLCGAENCRGRMMGFKALSDADKERLLPNASEAVKAMHLADAGLGPKVKKQQFVAPPRVPSSIPASAKVMRLVFPGPSCSGASIGLERNEETGIFQLYALKDFDVGDSVYEFWRQEWPQEGKVVIDMAFSAYLDNGDLPEGTLVQIDPQRCAASRSRSGELMFTGWDLFTVHSCEPNIAYDDWNEYEGDNWHATYAVKTIKKGDRLSVDFNSIFWDCTMDLIGSSDCGCGAPKCTGTVKGFKFLLEEQKKERYLMSSLRRLQPHYAKVNFGEALSPYVLVMWQKSDDAMANDISSGGCTTDEDDDLVLFNGFVREDHWHGGIYYDKDLDFTFYS